MLGNERGQLGSERSCSKMKEVFSEVKEVMLGNEGGHARKVKEVML